MHDECLVCRRGSYLGFSHPVCRSPERVDGYIGIFQYTAAMRKIIKSIKYRGVFDVFAELFYMIHQEPMYRFYAFKKRIPDAVIQPIPLHKNRLLLRGFNQSVYIGGFFSKLLRYPVVSILERTKETAPQASIPERSSRRKNMKDAFRVMQNTTVPKRIILIDDVVTSGYTVHESARILKEAGAREVYVFSLARG